MAIFVLILLGLCLGSFAGATIWRVHQQEKSKKTSANYSVLKGKSMCEACKHQLHARDLIPLLSWIELRGRCRYCQAKISWHNPALEILMAGLFVLSYLNWPYSFSLAGKAAFGAWLIAVVIMVVLAVYDLRWMELPDRLVLPLTIAAVALISLLSVEQGNPNFIFAPMLGALVLSGLFFGLFQLSDGKWIGGGDVKIAVALGLVAGGLVESILLLFIASLMGVLVSIPILLKGKKASHKVPFGPFLIVATYATFLWGSTIIDWYMRLIEV